MERKRPNNRLLGETSFDIDKKETKHSSSINVPQNVKNRGKRPRRGGRKANRSSGDEGSSNSNGSVDQVPQSSARRSSFSEKTEHSGKPPIGIGIRSPEKQNIANQSKAVTEQIAEPSDIAGLESAAFLSRLAYDKMTPLEMVFFPDLQSPASSLKAYLYIRNKILLLWIEATSHQLLIENVLPHIESPFSQDVDLIRRIFHFLERQSLINFGVFRISKPLKPLKSGRSVIILGAGMAGLGAARQLSYFGMEVTVLEARDRVGGRIDTYRNGDFVTDLGAMVIMGLGGNPVNILSRQIYMDLAKVRPKCPLYDHTGTVVPRHKDEFVEREWNKLLEATVFLSHRCGFNYFDGKPLSLGEMMQLIIMLQEKHVMDVQAVHQQSVSRLYDQLENNLQKMCKLRESIKKSSAEYQELKIRCGDENSSNQQFSTCFTKDDFLVRVKRIELQTCVQEYEQLEQQSNELERRIKDLEDRPPADQYLSTKDRHVLEWHMANLEFANAIPLDNLSLANWSQDDEYELKGAHLIVRNGYSVVPTAMAEGIDIRLNHRVCQIMYDDRDQDGVRIVCMAPDGEIKSFTADACLCTLPLGILKESIETSQTAAADGKGSKLADDCGGPPVFCPPLPKWKSDAAERLGYGNLNKIILCFENAFWDTSINIFGHVAGNTAPRGECFLFWTCWSSPVLLALVSGEAADEIEKVSDEEAISRCMKVLRTIFGTNAVPEPVSSLVTRWRADPFARGSYSHIAVGSSGEDYDIMAAPVKIENSPISKSRLFFAGEHTMRQFPASVHGALLSGYREAGRIANLFLDGDDDLPTKSQKSL